MPGAAARPSRHWPAQTCSRNGPGTDLTPDYVPGLILCDLYSGKYTFVQLRNKRSIVLHIDELNLRAIAVTNKPLQVFRSDNGSEFANHGVESYLRSAGIDVHRSTPYLSWENSKAERGFGVLKPKARACALRAGHPPSYWCYCLVYAALIHALIPTRWAIRGADGSFRVCFKTDEGAQLVSPSEFESGFLVE